MLAPAGRPSPALAANLSPASAALCFVVSLLATCLLLLPRRSLLACYSCSVYVRWLPAAAAVPVAAHAAVSATSLFSHTPTLRACCSTCSSDVCDLQISIVDISISPHNLFDDKHIISLHGTVANATAEITAAEPAHAEYSLDAQ